MEILNVKKKLKWIRNFIKDKSKNKSNEENNITEKSNEENKKGVNLIGYSRTEMGFGQGCRYTAKALDAEKINFGIKTLSISKVQRENDISWIHKEIDKAMYNVNIFHVGANSMKKAYKTLGQDFWSERYNIGYWPWELTDFPDEWINNFNFVDEIWAPSKFAVNGIKKKSPVPVIYIPHSIKIDRISKISRKNFGLPDNTFLFLTMYCIHSNHVRKNPKGVIEAFKSTFEPNDMSVGLVVKILNPSFRPEEVQELNELAGGYNNIYFIFETLDREDVNALLNMVDCFVSLHRSEGFGMAIAESMYLGTPAIATNWSGNTDYMNDRNACLVRYELVKIDRDTGPFKVNQKWAEPDKEHAAYYMKKLITDKYYYNKISRNGKKTIRKKFSPEVVGRMIRNRLEKVN